MLLLKFNYPKLGINSNLPERLDKLYALETEQIFRFTQRRVCRKYLEKGAVLTAPISALVRRLLVMYRDSINKFKLWSTICET